MTHEFLGKFFALYKSLPCLWNKRDSRYNDKGDTEIAMMQLMILYRDLSPGATLTRVKEELKTFRKSMMKEHRRLKKEGFTAKPDLWYYDNLKFLVEENAAKGADIQKEIHSKQSKEVPTPESSTGKGNSQKRSHDDAGAPAQKHKRVAKDQYDELAGKLRPLSAEQFTCIEKILDNIFKFADHENQEWLNNSLHTASRQEAAANTETQSETVDASVQTDLITPRGSNSLNMPTSSTSTSRQQAPHPIAVSPVQDTPSNTVDTQMASVPTSLNCNRPNSTSTSRQEGPQPITANSVPVQEAQSNKSSHNLFSRREVPKQAVATNTEIVQDTTYTGDSQRIFGQNNLSTRCGQNFQNTAPSSTIANTQEIPQPTAANLEPLQGTSHIPDPRTTCLWTNPNRPCGPTYMTIIVSPTITRSQESLQPMAVNTQPVQDPSYSSNTPIALEQAIRSSPYGSNSMNTVISSSGTSRQEAPQAIAANSTTFQETQSNTTDTEIISDQTNLNRPPGSNSPNILPLSTIVSGHELHQPFIEKTETVQETQSNTTDTEILSDQTYLSGPSGSNSPNMLSSSTIVSEHDLHQPIVKTESDEETQFYNIDTEITSDPTDLSSSWRSNLNMVKSANNTSIQETPQSMGVNTTIVKEARITTVSTPTIAVRSDIYSPCGSNFVNKYPSQPAISRQEIFTPNTATAQEKKRSLCEKITFEKNYVQTDIRIPRKSKPPVSTSSRKPGNAPNRNSNQQNSTNTSNDQNQSALTISEVIIIDD